MNEIIDLESLPKTLDDLAPASGDLSGEYWTPSEPGESRRLIFLSVEKRRAPKQDAEGNLKEGHVDLPCAVFVEPTGDTFQTVFNGSKRLVAVFEENQFDKGTPFEITYQGKKKNRTNSKSSDTWRVVRLQAK